MIDRTLNYGRHHISAFLRAASPYRSVLDIGAGKGYDLALARREQPEARLYAIEVHQESIEYLAEQGVMVYKLNIEREPFPTGDGSVDVVLANQILEHTKELFWILHEVTRSLREGGSFIVGVPNLASLHNRFLLLLGLQPTPLQNASAHVRGFTKHDILRTLDTVFPGGYELRGFGGSNFYPLPPLLARPMAAMLPGMAWGIFLRLEKCRPYNSEFLDFPAHAKLETNFYVGPEEQDL
jgi:SAM-dependent methyltransferase